MNNTINFFVVVDRYDMDFDDDVLYCYEIQLQADLMRQGLGRLVSVSVFRFSRTVLYGGSLSFILISVAQHQVPPRAVLRIRIRDLVPF